MKAIKKSIFAIAALFIGACFAACSDANEYEETNTANPSFVNGYNDSLKIQHPDSLTNTYWARTAGVKVNAYGEEVQGYVESLQFTTGDEVIVKMSEGSLPESIKNASTTTWNDESGTYEYQYNPSTGAVDIKKVEVVNKKTTKTTLFSAVVTIGTSEVLIVSHFGDNPVQSYLTRQAAPVAAE
ncbi:MAG: hypothetical protein KBT34_13915 [Prevotella sp.]|nr:hypothetical protein [Candidatus Prevotella equi]